MEIIKVTLPKTKSIVEIKNFLTTSQSRQLQRIIASYTKMSSEGGFAQNITGDAVFEMQEKAVDLLVSGHYLEKTTELIPFTRDWLDNLPSEDGNLIYEKVNEVSNGSNLKEDAKKKS